MTFLDFCPIQGAYLDYVVPCGHIYFISVLVLFILVGALVALYFHIKKTTRNPEVIHEFAFCATLVSLFLIVMGGIKIHFEVRDHQEAVIKRNAELQELYDNFVWEIQKQKLAVKEVKRKLKQPNDKEKPDAENRRNTQPD